MWYVAAIALQVIALLHVIKTGRTQIWLYVVLFLPGLGALIYFAVFFLPWTKWQWEGQEGVAKIKEKFIDPDREIEKWQEELKFNDTVAAKLGLADAYAAKADWPMAIEYYKKCITGMYEHDVEINKKLASAYFFAKQWEEGYKTWQKVEHLRGGELKPDELLFMGQTRQNMGDNIGALKYYELATGRYAGLEGNYRYIELLTKMGKDKDMQTAREEAERKYEQFLPKYKNEQKNWITRIRKEFGE